MKPFVRGDVEGFFAFGLDSMLALLLISTLLLGFLGFDPELVFTRVLPGAAVSLIIGNGVYFYQALKLAREEGRDDVCAIPYGISTLTLIVYVFLVMFPTQQEALSLGMDKPDADRLAWHTGLIACIVSGAIEFLGAFVVHYIRRVTPQVVMLVAVAGTGIAFLSMDYMIRSFAIPLIGMPALALVSIFYFSGARPRLGIPGGFVVLAMGTLLAWTLHFLDVVHVVPGSPLNTEYIGLHLPMPEIFALWGSLSSAVKFLPIIVPLGFVFLVGSLQNIEAAAAAGDAYRPRPLLLTNGLGSLGAACMGSPFPTSIFLGHPGYKRIGARAGYSMINAVVWTLVCLTGTLTFFTWLIPVEAIMAIIVWIGVVVCAQNFQISEKRHIPAVIVGLLPAIAAFGGLVLKHGLAVGSAHSGINLFDAELEAMYATSRSFYVDGLFALGQGYIFSSMLWAGIIYYIIERRFHVAALWSAIGALLSLAGFIHSYEYLAGDIIGVLQFDWTPWASGYALMTVLLLVAPYLVIFVDDSSALVAEGVADDSRGDDP
ncbi:MAG: hypothetical protein RJQ10_06285 [Haliea sp.]|uniref:NCS2 family permease n=1 Tax=Haliea sp. TaxID=1932666 RepID=UPI0032EE8F86